MNDDKNFMKKAKSRKKAAALEYYCELLDRNVFCGQRMPFSK